GGSKRNRRSLQVQVRRALGGAAGGGVADAERERVEPRLLAGRIEDGIGRVLGAGAPGLELDRHPAVVAAEDAAGQTREAGRGVLRPQRDLDRVLVLPGSVRLEVVGFEVDVDRLVDTEDAPRRGL